MNRRRFLGRTAGAGVAAWAGAARALGKPRPLCPPSPAGPFPARDSGERHLIIPTDKPDEFNLKVMEFNPIAAPKPEEWELEVTGLVERPLDRFLCSRRQGVEHRQHPLLPTVSGLAIGQAWAWQQLRRYAGAGCALR